MGRFEKIPINISFSDCEQGVLRLVFMLQLACEHVCVREYITYLYDMPDHNDADGFFIKSSCFCIMCMCEDIGLIIIVPPWFHPLAF